MDYCTLELQQSAHGRMEENGDGFCTSRDSAGADPFGFANGGAVASHLEVLDQEALGASAFAIGSLRVTN